MAKRERRVFNKDMVAHVWAQQTQSEGRSSHGNFYFSGRTIYSYGSHFPIATFILNKKGERAVLFTRDTYSSTTGGHVNLTRRAVSNFKVFHVDSLRDLDVIHRGDGRIAADDRDIIFLAYKARVEDALIASRANRTFSQSRFGDAKETFAEAKEFAEWLGLNKLPFKLSRNQEQVWAEEEVRRQEYEKRVEERRAAELKKIEKQANEFLEQWRVATDPKEWNIPYSYEDFLTPEDHELAKRRHATQIGMWRQLLTDELPRSLPWNRALLRINGLEIETSRGARFPVEHGKKAFPLIVACKKHGREFVTNGHTIHLGHFKIDRIATDGTVTAGCHVVEWPEIEYAAKKLGIFEEASA